MKKDAEKTTNRKGIAPQVEIDFDMFEMLDLFDMWEPVLKNLAKDFKSGKVQSYSDTERLYYHSVLSRIAKYIKKFNV